MLITPRNSKQVLLLFRLNKEVNKKLFGDASLHECHCNNAMLFAYDPKMAKEQKDAARGKRVRREI